MNSATPAIQIENLSYAYGRAEAVHDLSLVVQPGRCYGLFGRNGAGKTTTMKCLLNLLRPQRGKVRVFGRDPAKEEVAVKQLLSYVPDQVAFYPWTTVRETLDYLASFRPQWNRKTEKDLFDHFGLDPGQRTGNLSKGQRTQVALIAAVCPETVGNEFQYRTLPLLLSQPVGRMEIWGEKMSVTVVAVVSAALVYWYSWRSALEEDPETWMYAGTLILAMVASATFWTLVARSMMGGLALNGVNGFIPLVFSIRRDWIPETTITRSAAAVAFLCYAGVMLWLGRRALAQFQVTGGVAGEDLLVAGPDVMPGAMAGWFRSRPTGAVLNLMRKEVHLLRPVLLISLLGLLGWISLPILGYTLERRSIAAIIMVMSFTPLIAVLAGSLSLGEERSSGTHSWNLTQPVPAGQQWLIKLVMALFTGLVCAVLLPAMAVMAGGHISGSPFVIVDLVRGMAWALWVLLLTFAAFWCVCVVNGTVRAVLWVFPVMIALTLAGRFGAWLAPEVAALAVSRFDLFANFRFTNAVSNIQLFSTSAPSMLFVLLLLAPTLLLAVIQSYRLYRRQLQDSNLFVIRRLLPLALVTFLSIFCWMAFLASVVEAKQQMWSMFRETHEAIERIQPGTANLDARHPLQLTVEDLNKAAPLSERTRRWLVNSSIIVVPDKPHPGQYCCEGNSRGTTFHPDQPYAWYLATINLPSGSSCTVSFRAGRGYGILGGVCK